VPEESSPLIVVPDAALDPPRADGAVHEAVAEHLRPTEERT
jgi:hypothetical protein